MNILIVKTSSMGDVVHALPVLDDIQAHYPDAQIDWLVETPFHQITKLHPAIRTVIPMSWRKWRKNLRAPATRNAIRSLIATLRAAQYDRVIDLQGLVKSAVWAKLARGKTLHGFDARSAREPLARLAYTHAHAVSPDLLAIERSRLLCAAALGYAMPQTRSFGIVAPPMQAADWSLSAPYWACIHGSSDDARLWPQADWVQLAQAGQTLGLAVVLIWGSDAERERSVQLQISMHALGIAAHVPPFLTIAQTAQVLSASQAVVGLDTGFTHLAGALGKPCISLHRTHDPARTGVQGDGRCIALGGIGQSPTYTAVAAAFESLFAT